MLLLWSPFANLQSEELLNASMQLPIPTGIKTNVTKGEGYLNTFNLFNKYKTLFIVNPIYHWDDNLHQNVLDSDKISLDLDLSTPDKILLFRDFINEIHAAGDRIQLPSRRWISKFIEQLEDNQITFKFYLNASDLEKLLDPAQEDDLKVSITENQVENMLDQIAGLLDRHNSYFDKMSKYNISKVMNNYMMYSMLRISYDPVNLTQAHAPIDSVTGPLKDIGNLSEESKTSERMAPGNSFDKAVAITINQVGKTGIGICAVGLKSYFALTHYCNYILNHGTPEQLQRLLVLKGEGLTLKSIGQTKRLVANIRAKDPNTITNDMVLEALASVTNDADAALVLSALLSLATDNAKELLLSKLNASPKTIGMYIYGITLGFDFRDIATIMMSPVGSVLNEVAGGDIFNSVEEYSKVEENLFGYFDYGPKRVLNKYDIKTTPDGKEKINQGSPLGHFANILAADLESARKGYTKNDNGYDLQIHALLLKYAADQSVSLKKKLTYLNGLKNRLQGKENSYFNSVFNQLIDFCQRYCVQMDKLRGDFKSPVNGKAMNGNMVYEDIKQLSKGAQEMFVLGRVLGINQGLKTQTDRLIGQLNNFELAIYNAATKGNVSREEKESLAKDIEEGGLLVDVIKFYENKNGYRDKVIAQYENYKTAFNIYDVVATVPHYLGYIETLACAKAESMRSFKFRSMYKSGLPLSIRYNLRNQTKLQKGIQNYIGDYIWKEFIKQSKYRYITIPKGNKMFTKDGDKFISEQNITVDLATDWGRAAFRLWFESEVVPTLKEGRLGTGRVRVGQLENRFIQDLTDGLITNTISRNPTVIKTLPINMLPRTDSERNVFNEYKADFNKVFGQTYITQLSDDGTQREYHSVGELFALYAMVADSWKLGENSLVPILEDKQNDPSGIIADFHKFESDLDKAQYRDNNGMVHDVTLNVIEQNENGYILYIAPHASPYTDSSDYVQSKNLLTKKVELMHILANDTLSNDEYDSEQEGLYDDNYADDYVDEGYEESYSSFDYTRKGNFQFVEGRKGDPNLFPEGVINVPFVQMNLSQLLDEDGNRMPNVDILYDKNGKIISYINKNAEPEVVEKLRQEVREIPYDIVDGEVKINTKDFIDQINKTLNPC